METNKIKLTFFDGSIKWIQATDKKIIKAGKITDYVFGKYTQVKKIESQRTGYYDKSHKYMELHFDLTFERWRKNRYRIEAANPPGHEDYTGYGNRTEGKKSRFYIGRSTGFLPIYLEILKSNSYGGGSLYLTKGRKFRVVY